MDMLYNFAGVGGWVTGTHSHRIMEGENRDLNVFRFRSQKDGHVQE